MERKARQDTSRLRAFAAWLLLAAAGCVAAPPPVAVTTSLGEVRAQTHAEAQAVADSLRRLRPLVLAALPDTVARPMDVWLDPTLAHVDETAEVAGFTSLSESRIRLGASLSGASRDFVLAHELVHAALGPGWDPLPAVMKEGLCDLIAARVVPEDAVRARAVSLFAARLAFGRQELLLECEQPGFGGRMSARLAVSTGADAARTPSEALALAGRGVRVSDDVSDEPALYGYGLLVVERIERRVGLSGLHALCAAARRTGQEVIPVADVLAAAGLDEDLRNWARTLEQELRAPELQAIVALKARDLGEAVANALRWRFPDLSGAEFLRQVRPSLVLGTGGDALVLGDVPALREVMLAAWRRDAPTPLAVGHSVWRTAADGLHVGSVELDEGGDLRLQWLHVEGASGGPAPPAAFEVLVRLGRDAEGTFLSSTLTGDFADFRVEVLGVPVADLRAGLNARLSRPDGGAVTVTCRLDPALEVESAVFYGPGARLLVLQRAADEAEDVRIPVAVELRR